MDRTFEHTILAYLDGLLDTRSERKFLKEVSLDPEKRKLLRQYKQLHARLRDRSRPVAVPLRTQQALANRIPILREVVPNTILPPATSGSGAGLLANTGRRVISILAISAILVGTLSVLTLTPGEENVRIEADAAAGDGLEMTEGSDVASARVQQNPPTTGHSLESIDASRVTAHTEYHERTSTAVDVQSLESAIRENVIPGETGKSDAVSASTALPPRLTSSPQRASASSVFEHELPPAILLTATPFASGGEPRMSDYPLQFPVDLFSGRLHFCLESGAAQFGVSGDAASGGSGITGVFLAALRYDVTRTFTAGIEIGQSHFARERLENRRRALGTSGGGEIIVIDRALVSEPQSWLRAHGVYSVNPENRFRFEAAAGAGVLLKADRAVLLSCGLSAVYSLSTSLQARAGLHYSGTWLAPAAAQPLNITPGDGVIGIIRNAEAAETVFSTSVEFRFGFGVLIW